MGFINSKTIDYAQNARQVYVDSVEGSDVAVHGRGGKLQPYATIEAALAAIVADVSLGQFCIMLAPGNYGTGPIAWPVIAGKNISVFGDGENCNITTTITYTSIGGVDEESVVFLNVGINDIDIDLAAAFAAVKVAQVYFVNCGVNVNRVDASPPGGPQVVRLFTCLITGLESSSVILVTGSQYLGGPITINATGFVLVEASSLAGCPAFVVDGTIACSSTLLATAVITGTGNLLLDATAQYPTLAAASITGPTVGNMDTAPFIGYTPAVPANWTVVPVQVAEALDELAAREPTVFVFQEGGTQEKNVYDNWADLYAALLVAGNSPKRIMIDDSVTSPCVIPAGAYDLSNVELMGKQFQTFLEFANGATLTGCFQKVSNGLRIDSQSAAEIFVLTAGAHTIVLDNQSVLSANVAPMFNVDAGAVFQIMMNNESTLVNGGFAILDVDVGGTGNISEYSGSAAGTGNTSGAGSINVFRVGAPDRKVGAVTGGEAAAKQIDLGTLVEHTTVIFTIQGFNGITYSFDYTLTDGATSTVLDWNGLGLDGVIVGGENYNIQWWA